MCSRESDNFDNYGKGDDNDDDYDGDNDGDKHIMIHTGQ